MNELSLFSGAGGGVYGSKLLGWKTVWYVEWGGYCQKVIAQRIKDAIFDEAPIFTDVREFAQSGAARAYRGFVDVVSGGFPCQPFSVAGKRKASDDSRDMWPATMDVIKAVKPPIVYLENVPGLLSATVDDGTGRLIHYFGTILRDLAESGYDVKWCVLGADDVGAPHHRKRLWILAVHADTKHNGSLTLSQSRGERPSIFNQPQRQNSTSEFEGVDSSSYVANTECVGQSRQGEHVRQKRSEKIETWEADRVINQSQGEKMWWDFEPDVDRVANGVADRSHRLKSIGNGQVSVTMAAAYEILSREFIKEQDLNISQI